MAGDEGRVGGEITVGGGVGMLNVGVGASVATTTGPAVGVGGAVASGGDILHANSTTATPAWTRLRRTFLHN